MSPPRRGRSRSAPLALQAPVLLVWLLLRCVGADVPEIERQIRALYEEHNPTKLSSVPLLMQKYKGNEAKLLKTIREKYADMAPAAVEEGVVELLGTHWDAAVPQTKAMLVDFTDERPWCGPCMQLRGQFERAGQILAEEGFRGVLGRVDATRRENQKLMQKYDIHGYPTMLMFLDGILVDHFDGGFAADAIAKYMRQFLAPPPDYYTALGVARDATNADIKKAFKAASRAVHPDTAVDGGDPDRFALISTAYETLSDVDARSMYDAFGGIKFQQKGMQRDYMRIKGIKLKLYQEEDGAVQVLNTAGYRGRDKTKSWVIDFFAPWCGHCQELRPQFHKVAVALEGKINFASVDCDTETSLCDHLGIDAFPQVRMLVANKASDAVEVYEGALMEDPIRSWVEDVLADFAVEITEANMDELITKQTSTWLLDYSAGPWCGPCTYMKATMRKLARQLQPYAKVGIVDCDTQPPLCERQGIEGFPTIHVCESPMEHENGLAVCHELENPWDLQPQLLIELCVQSFAIFVRPFQS